MRLRLLPLALCMLLMLFMPQNASAINVEHNTNSSLSLANTTLAFKTNPKTESKKIAEVELKSATNHAAKTVKDKLAAQNPGKSDFSRVEEFSYKNITDVRSNSGKNYATARSTYENSQELREASFGQGMFYGFAIMVILLNLVCYFLFDDRLFLFYSITLFATVNLLLFSDGLMFLIGFNEFANPLAVESLLVLATCVFASWFASRYLILSEVFPKLRWVASALFGIAGVLMIMSFITGSSAVAVSAMMISYAVLGTYFLSGVYLFSKKNYPKFYVIALSIPLLFAIDYFVMRNLGLEFLMTQPSHLKAAIIAEMLMLSYAIVYRMRAIKDENELRQTELRIFLKRQEIMNRKNAMQLMEEVYLENLIMHYDLDGFEIKLLQYISEGKDNTKIARKLKITESEVEEVTKELYHKLEISEQIQEDYRMVDAQADYIYN
ncbi:hypothetical protein J1N09_11575 [Aureitalea sp. L0-47]|uniref:7TM diverse intracellular signaling domain-containing protein n=1 Tax=Aureitalea sp. L0-47 TaxID=2816962 RepID=UPI002238533B|nr:7TM diverse intracellular signaling domain-containing protein [Aureitalea sp. L0-47]MCW5520484.1 hypothetical protein [Aureitalea sp. L0-47]